MRSLIFFYLVVAFAYPSAAGEPPQSRSLFAKTRMSTHIVTGKVKDLEIVYESSGKLVENPGDELKDKERFLLKVEVAEVLFADEGRPVREGEVLAIRFGRPGLTASVYAEGLKGKTLIFWLSRDAEHGARADYFYPFYGDGNLAAPAEKLDAVRAAVAKLRAASQ